MEQYKFLKKSALALAVICGSVGFSAQAEELNNTGNKGIAEAFALGTQTQAAAEAQESQKTDADLKLSPNLFRLKEYAKQEKSTQEKTTSRTRRAVENTPLINVDIVINGSVDSVRGELDAAGFTVDSTYGNNLGGTISADDLEALSQIAQVKRITLPIVKKHAGIVDNQADFVEYSKKVKETLKNAPTGKGITVGILSDSFNCIAVRNEPGTISEATDVNNGELPADVYVVKEEPNCIDNGEDEGRAMAQLVHDIAPDAKIAFYAPQTQTDFAQGIQTLALPKGQFDSAGHEGAGANVIVDDLSFLAEPAYETGIIGESATRVVKKGVTYFSAAGNYTLTDSSGNKDATVYTTSSARFTPYTPTSKSPTGLSNAQVLNVGKNNATVLPVYLANTHKSPQMVGIWWGQSYKKGSQSKIMACITKADGTAINSQNMCETQELGQDPVILLQYLLPRNLSGGKYGLQIFQLEGVKPTDITVLSIENVSIDPAFATGRGSIFGHASAPAAFTLGAADFAETPQCNAALSTTQMEPFSSHGNSPLLFDADGNAINVIPNKPDATAIDGVSTSFFGSEDGAASLRVFKDPACNLKSTYRFYGTSAAAPNAAAVAALIQQDNPGIAAEDVYKTLRQTATAIGKAPTQGSYNYVSGYGLINAEKAINTLRTAHQ
ncbi:S8 family serine peptidase [uncultured Pluralibacter sp.]|uniref:S8 family peptidase n=1 Tax=uncultured Pluralibacter sp. TaxID=1490864 RepID=UPI00260EE3BF|nr:S8 family serine peptidase [uncultured Pluralibacter sp.]